MRRRRDDAAPAKRTSTATRPASRAATCTRARRCRRWTASSSLKTRRNAAWSFLVRKPRPQSCPFFPRTATAVRPLRRSPPPSDYRHPGGSAGERVTGPHRPRGRPWPSGLPRSRGAYRFTLTGRIDPKQSGSGYPKTTNPLTPWATRAPAHGAYSREARVRAASRTTFSTARSFRKTPRLVRKRSSDLRYLRKYMKVSAKSSFGRVAA